MAGSDDEFDFSDFDDMDIDGPTGGIDEGRNVVTSTSSNIKTSFLDNLMGDGDNATDKMKSNAKELINKATPNLLGDKVGGDVLDAFGSATDAIDEARDKITTGATPLLKSIKGVVPKGGMFDKLTDGLADFIGVDLNNRKSRGPTDDEKIASNINGAMGEFAVNLAESQTKLTALTASITDANMKRVQETISSGNIVAMQSIDMDNKYYRESLKLEYKQLFELKNINRGQLEVAKDVTKKLDAVIHNTALPDGLKMQTKEAIALQMKMSAGESLYENLFRSNSWLDDVKKNIGDKAKSLTGSILDSMDTANGGIDMAGGMIDGMEMDEDMLASLSPTERAKLSKEGMVSGMAAGTARGSIMSMVTNKLSKTKAGKKIRSVSDSIFSNPYDKLKMMSKQTESGAYGSALNMLAGIFKPQAKFTESKTYDDKVNLKGLATFDNKIYNTISVVLPEILNQQLRELKVLNGNKDAKVQKYFHSEKKFMTEDEVNDNLTDGMSNGYKEDNLNYKFREVVKRLEQASGIELSESETKTFVKSLAEYDGRISSGMLTHQIEKDDGLFKGVSSKEKMKFASLIQNAGNSNYYEEDDEGKQVLKTDADRVYETDELLRVVDESKKKAEKKIYALISDGFINPLIESGVVDYNPKTQKYSISYEVYKKMNVDAMMEAFDERTLVISKTDIEAADNAKEMKETKKAFNDTVSDFYGKGKEFVKDKKIDTFLKEKVDIGKGEIEKIIKSSDQYLTKYESYNVAIGYIDKKYETAKSEYYKLEGQYKGAKSEAEKTTIKQKMEIVKNTVTSIAKEKTKYDKLRDAYVGAKDYVAKNDIYDLEKDIKASSTKLHTKATKFVEDKELDIMFNDLTKLANFTKSKGVSLAKSVKDTVSNTEAYQTVESFYDSKIKTFIEEESKLKALIEKMPKGRKKQAMLKKLVKLRKLNITVVKERDKALKKFTLKNMKKQATDTLNKTKDLKYTDVKEAGKKVGGKVGSAYKGAKSKISKDEESGEAKVDVVTDDDTKVEVNVDTGSGGIISKLSSLIDILKPKKKIVGDSDGDGDRDNGWKDRLDSMFKRKKKDSDEKSTKQAERDTKTGGWLGKLLGGAFMIIPSLLGGLSKTVKSSTGVLGTIATGIGGILSFFTGKGLFSLIGKSMMFPIKFLAKRIGLSLMASTGLLTQMLGGVFKLIGFKKAGSFLSKAGKNATSKAMDKSIIKRAFKGLAKHKGKFAIGALLAYALTSEASASDELDPTRLSEVEKFVDEEENKPEPTNETTNTPDKYKEKFKGWMGDQLSELSNLNPLNGTDVGIVEGSALLAGTSYTISEAYEIAKDLRERHLAKKSEIEDNKKEAVDDNPTKKKLKQKAKKKLRQKAKKIKTIEGKVPSSLQKFAKKLGPKTLMKKLPFVGTALGLSSAAESLAEGEYAEAGIGLISSLATMIPFVGVPASIAIDAYGKDVLESVIGGESSHNNMLIADTKKNPDGTPMSAAEAAVVGGAKGPDYKPADNDDGYTSNPNKFYENIRVDKPTLSSSTPLTKGDKYLLEAISKYESGTGDKGYDIINNEKVLKSPKKLLPTEMTLFEIFKLQKALTDKHKSGAVGKYQLIPETLKETFPRTKIKITDLFDSVAQDTIIIKRLELKRKYRAWKDGLISDRHFIYELSKEFASIENPGTGKTWHTKTKNVAHNMYPNMKAVLAKVRELDKMKDSGIEDEEIPKAEQDKKKSGKKIVKPRKSNGKGSTLMSGLKMAFRALFEFFGNGMSGGNAPGYSAKVESNGDAETSGPNSQYREQSSGGNIKVDLPETFIKDNDLCGLSIKKLPPIKKAVDLAKNLVFNGDPKYLVIHNTAGSNLYLGRMKKDGYGTQLWIDKDGTIILVGNITSVVYHVGRRRSQYDDIKSTKSIGIEMVCAYKEGVGWDAYTEKQKESLRKIGACIMNNFNITKDRVVWHALISYKTKDEGKEGAMLLRGMELPPKEATSTKPSSSSGKKEQDTHTKATLPTKLSEDKRTSTIQTEVSDSSGKVTDIKTKPTGTSEKVKTTNEKTYTSVSIHKPSNMKSVQPPHIYEPAGTSIDGPKMPQVKTKTTDAEKIALTARIERIEKENAKLVKEVSKSRNDIKPTTVETNLGKLEELAIDRNKILISIDESLKSIKLGQGNMTQKQQPKRMYVSNDYEPISTRRKI